MTGLIDNCVNFVSTKLQKLTPLTFKANPHLSVTHDIFLTDKFSKTEQFHHY